MIFGDIKRNRKFQVGSDGKAVSDVFLSIGDGLSVDQTYAVYKFPDETPVIEVVDAEQPKDDD